MAELNKFLKPCTYRHFEANSLICTIASSLTDSRKGATPLTSVEVCAECPVPDISKFVNCTHLSFTKQHMSFHQYLDGTLEAEVGDCGWTARCKVIRFANREDYQIKCSEACSQYNPIHRNLSADEPLHITNFNGATASDRNLRQAVLTILYSYHARHPDRYDYFDVTPAFIAQSLGISVQDVARVIAPMQEEGEVEVLQFESDRYFNYVRITSQGIQMIDEEPLFSRLDTAGIRIMGDQFNFDHSPVGAVNAGSNNLNQATVNQEVEITSTELTNAFNQLRQQVESLPIEQRQEAVELVEILEDQAKLTKVNKSLIKMCSEKLLGFLGNAAANTLGTIAATLLMAP